MNDKRLERTLFISFVKALKQTDRFVIWTDEASREVPQDVYEVNVAFVPAEDYSGTIFARLYNPNNLEIWDNAKHFHDYPKEKMLIAISRQMVANILNILSNTPVETSYS